MMKLMEMVAVVVVVTMVLAVPAVPVVVAVVVALLSLQTNFLMSTLYFSFQQFVKKMKLLYDRSIAYLTTL